MLLKIAVLFLVVMMAIAVFGRLRFPDAIKRRLMGRSAGQLDKPKICKSCGKYIIGTGGCDCGKPPAKRGQ